MKKFTKAVAGLLVCFTLAFTLTACVPTGSTNAAQKMKDAGYSVTINTQETASGRTSSITAYKNSEYLEAIWWKTSDLAKQAKENMQANGNSAYIYKSKGKCFFYGTEQALKDFESFSLVNVIKSVS